MFTITLEQVQKDKEYALEKTYSVIKEYVDKSNYSVPSKSVYQNACVAVVLNDTLNTWEQGDFTHEEYINYLTGKGYINLIGRIRSV